jgi:hypothetical protein
VKSCAPATPGLNAQTLDLSTIEREVHGISELEIAPNVQLADESNECARRVAAELPDTASPARTVTPPEVAQPLVWFAKQQRRARSRTSATDQPGLENRDAYTRTGE